MVDTERRFETVGRQHPLGHDEPRVVDQHVDAIEAFVQLGGASTDRRQIGEIERHAVDGVTERSLLDLVDGGTGLLRVATRDRDAVADRCQRDRCLLADSGVRAGDHDVALTHRSRH